MEGISVSLSKALRRYWRRKGYERLTVCRRRPRRRVKLAVLGSLRRRRIWRLKIRRRLRLRLRLFPTSSPKRFFLRLRDAYVNFMLRFANSRVVVNNGFGGAGGGAPVVAGSRKPPMRDYEEKVIVEIYKSLMWVS